MPLRPIRVYAAGKFHSPKDWRPVEPIPSWDEWMASTSKELHLPGGTDFGIDLLYVGPYFASGEDDGKPHDFAGYDGGHGQSMSEDHQAQVARASLDQIARADIIYLRLDSNDAYGTLTEVGYAAALKKPFVVFPAADVERSWPKRDELWFARHLASLVRPHAAVENAVRFVFEGTFKGVRVR